jgi:hypothetical protein
MLRPIRLLVFTLFVFCLMAANVQAKGGHGKGGRGGAGHGGGRKAITSRSHPRSPTRVHGPQQTQMTRRPTGHAHSQFGQRPTVKRHPSWANSQASEPVDTEQPILSKHRLREDRKLQHRQQVAEHLRKVGDRNGNSNLYDVADRKDQKAQAHYDKKMRKYGEPLPTDEEVAEGEPLPEGGLSEPEPLPVEVGERVQKYTGRQNALYRQLRNEQRKFTTRMEAAEQLRQLAETNGDPALLQQAEQLEQSALDHFNKRMAKIAEFQERFDLPTPEEFATLPTSVEP